MKEALPCLALSLQPQDPEAPQHRSAEQGKNFLGSSHRPGHTGRAGKARTGRSTPRLPADPRDPVTAVTVLALPIPQSGLSKDRSVGEGDKRGARVGPTFSPWGPRGLGSLLQPQVLSSPAVSWKFPSDSPLEKETQRQG